MKEIICLLGLMLAISLYGSHRENDFSVSLNYAIPNLDHYYIRSLDNGLSIDLNFRKKITRNKAYQYGLGLTYSNFDYEYGAIKKEGKSSFNELSPYFIITKTEGFITPIVPFLKLGATFLFSDNENYQEENPSFFMEPGISFEYQPLGYSRYNRLFLGFFASYKFIFHKFDFETGFLPADIITLSDDTFQYLTLGVYLSYSFE